MTHKTQAIILSRHQITETGRVYIMYSRDVGKIEAMARGSRKILSKLAPHLEPPIFSDVMIARGKQLDKLAGAVTIKSFPKIISDLSKIETVFSCLETLNSLTKFNQKDEKIFLLLEKFLYICEDVSEDGFKRQNENLKNAFLIKLLALLGYNFVDYVEKGNIKLKQEELNEVRFILENKFENILNSSFKISEKTKQEIYIFIETRKN